jgi:hypothetical protein
LTAPLSIEPFPASPPACVHDDRGHADSRPHLPPIAPSAIETPRFLTIVSTTNHAAMLIKLLAYNLMRRFAVASCPPELHGWRASWLRRALIWTPGRLVRSGRQWSLRLPPSSMLARNLN